MRATFLNSTTFGKPSNELSENGFDQFQIYSHYYFHEVTYTAFQGQMFWSYTTFAKTNLKFICIGQRKAMRQTNGRNRTHRTSNKILRALKITAGQVYLHVSGVAPLKTLSINIFLTASRHQASSGPARGFDRRLIWAGSVDRCPLVARGNRGPFPTATGEEAGVSGPSSRC